MTVAAYDGRSVAIDRQVTNGNLRRRGQKWLRLRDGSLVFWTGAEASAIAVAHWCDRGGDPAAWPECQRGDDWANVMLLHGGALYHFETEPHPVRIRGRFAAWGSGRDFAIGAMDRGASATEAVRVACRHDVNCGMGVDAFDLRGVTLRGQTKERALRLVPPRARAA